MVLRDPEQCIRRGACCALTGMAFAIVMSLSVMAGFASADERAELVLLNWSDFMDPELIEAFERRHHAQVKQVFFAQNQDRDRMIVAANGRGYDVAVLNDIMLSSYRRNGWLAPLEPQNTPNLKNIDPKWLDLYPAARGYAAPYFWGTLGIAYRADLVPEGIASWKQFFASNEALRDRIAMTGDSHDLIGMALKALGHSANSTNTEELAAAEALLLAQKPYVHSYDYVSLTAESSLVKGEVAASMMYNGDALMVAEHEPEIRFAVPEEGGNLWVDYLVVLEGSNNKDLARAFVDFLNEPANAAQLAQYVYCATPNEAAEALLPDDFLHDPVIYPPAAIIDRSEIFTALPAREERRRAMIYARLVD